MTGHWEISDNARHILGPLFCINACDVTNGLRNFWATINFTTWKNRTIFSNTFSHGFCTAAGDVSKPLKTSSRFYGLNKQIFTVGTHRIKKGCKPKLVQTQSMTLFLEWSTFFFIVYLCVHFSFCSFILLKITIGL